MSATVEDPLVPKAWIVSACALVAFSIASVSLVRLTGMGGTQLTLPAAIESRDLQFADGKDGAVLVYDASDHRLIEELAPGSNGFVRVVLRGLARERRLNDVGAEPAFRLTRYENGQLALRDTSTSKIVDLAAFGAANERAFARLMAAGRSDK